MVFNTDNSSETWHCIIYCILFFLNNVLVQKFEFSVIPNYYMNIS